MIGFAEGGPCVVVCEQGYLVLRANTHGSCSSNVCKSFFKIVFVSYVVNIFHPHSLITCLLPRRKRREKDSGAPPAPPIYGDGCFILVLPGAGGRGTSPNTASWSTFRASSLPSMRS